MAQDTTSHSNGAHLVQSPGLPTRAHMLTSLPLLGVEA